MNHTWIDTEQIQRITHSLALTVALQFHSLNGRQGRHLDGHKVIDKYYIPNFTHKLHVTKIVAINSNYLLFDSKQENCKYLPLKNFNSHPDPQKIIINYKYPSDNVLVSNTQTTGLFKEDLK